MRTLEFMVTGDSQIYCGSCEARITRSLRQLNGVREVNASARTQEIRVTIDPEVISPEEVEDALETIGYTVAKQAEDSR